MKIKTQGTLACIRVQKIKNKTLSAQRRNVMEHTKLLYFIYILV